MTYTREILVSLLPAILTKNQSEQSVVYAFEEKLLPGKNIIINRGSFAVKEPSVLLFVDMDPKANWGHSCEYIFLDKEGKAIEKLGSQFPPDENLIKLISKPATAEDWMLLTTGWFNKTIEL